MRFAEKHPSAGEQGFTFTLDGASVPALPGDTLASALYAAGIRAWRRSRYGDERSLLCGIGLCFDCLLKVDGIDNQRACQVLAQAGMRVETSLVKGPTG